MPKFAMGWVRQPKDDRDLVFKAPRRVTANLPDSFSVEANLGPQLNQGDLGRCGPTAMRECITYEQKVEKMEVVEASALYIYYNTRYLMGTVNQDSGVENRSMVKSLSNWGFCTPQLWPDDNTKYKNRPTADAYAYGAKNRISSYAAVTKDWTQMCGTLVSGHVFIFGFDVFSGIMSDQAAQTGVVPDPKAGETPEGGHDVTFVAYDKNGFGKIAGPAFKFRNHWMNSSTVPWGDGGMGYISATYATGPHASDFWALNAVPGSPIPTPPVPVPPAPIPVPTGQRVITVIGGKLLIDGKEI